MRVVIGMSGGVDSSVAAMLLKNQGYEVIGLFMKNWDDTEDPTCPLTSDYEDVAAVCDRLKIDFYPVNFTREYWDGVFSHFLDEMKAGYTPNPDILCNREIKFKVLLDKALEIGAEKLATGHYAQVSDDYQLLRGFDRNKDQSYFLYTLSSSILEKVLFPIGHLQKPELRKLAEEAGLITHNKKDSTGICFIGKRNFREFLAQYMPKTKGVFQTPEGVVVGEHEGAWYYTIGQRKGMGIGGPGDAWFVVDKDIKTHVVTVVQGEDHPALLASALTATEASWTSGFAPPLPYSCSAKIRYRQEDEPCIIEQIEGEELTIRFQRPQRAITPRQSIVFYDQERCLGGAMIKNSII